jgi:uncharacterized protein YndB with AHSA1/START domain
MRTADKSKDQDAENAKDNAEAADPIRSDPGARSFAARAERDLSAPVEAIYRAFTTDWERWFAAPGTAVIEAIVGHPWFFETRHDQQRHPHYGRFLRLDPARTVVTTWVTGAHGTDGAETVLTVELQVRKGGTHVVLIHEGFYEAAAATQHEEAWRGPVLDALAQFASATA